MSEINMEVLIKSLPIIAKITGGYATLTDNKGKRIKTVNSKGQIIENMSDIVYDIAKKAGEKKEPIIGTSHFEPGAETWCLPIGNFVICASNIERIQRNEEFKNSLIQSLPFIARVAGGEAVVFDKKGKWISSVDSKGRSIEKFSDNFSKSAMKCMDEQQPLIGGSSSIHGASAVRIPITKEFGFGFNNEETIQKEQKLMDEVKKYQFAKYNFDDIIGNSKLIKKAKEIAKIASKSTSNVLVYGETGTGKELFAQSIHNESNRRHKPFLAINCGALPASLIESNLFGYESGAFTGAKKGGQAGIFEQANGGTILLDEISEMNIELQTKLLRVLQEREVQRIGSSKVIPIDVRIIACTNKDLFEISSEGKFRKDLFYRLNVIDINLPSLRNIKDDIPPIINSAIEKMNPMFGKFVKGIDTDALEVMLNHQWLGNIRELMNVIEKAFNIIGNEQIIRKEHIRICTENDYEITESVNNCDENKENKDNIIDYKEGLEKIIGEYEKQIIHNALLQTKGHKAKTAKLLKISKPTLWRKIKEYDL